MPEEMALGVLGAGGGRWGCKGPWGAVEAMPRALRAEGSCDPLWVGDRNEPARPPRPGPLSSQVPPWTHP